MPEPHAKPAGNWNDDDGFYQDESLEQSADIIPQADKATGVDTGVTKIPTPNRLITRRFPIANPSQLLGPVLLMPAQPLRKGLIIEADCDIYIAGSSNEVQAGAGVHRIGVAGTNPSVQWQDDNYTGAVWVQALETVAPAALYASCWAIVDYPEDKG
jgi:hypothetical protein